MERGKFSNNSTRYARTDKGGGGFYFYATYEFFNKKKSLFSSKINRFLPFLFSTWKRIVQNRCNEMCVARIFFLYLRTGP